MLIPTVPAKEFERFGFKKCAGDYGKHGCYYLCVSRGIKMLFVIAHLRTPASAGFLR